MKLTPAFILAALLSAPASAFEYATTAEEYEAKTTGDAQVMFVDGEANNTPEAIKRFLELTEGKNGVVVDFNLVAPEDQSLMRQWVNGLPAWVVYRNGKPVLDGVGIPQFEKEK